MSGCEQDNSDYNSTSPFSQMGSPSSSPSQQVPQLANFLTELSCKDTFIGKGKPSLHIIEEPQNHFRFRYKSEMMGTHGCLLGKSNQNSKANKTHPTVELRNYDGKARIRCTLARHDSPKDHPHKLQDDQDRDVSSIVPEHNSYKVAFSGMGIIHTAKKDVAQLLFKNYAPANTTPYIENQFRIQCENEAKIINLNIVRLKFTAHDLETDMLICPPVFSKPIHNLKSAATNDLKICRMSRSCGRARGGDNIFLFVEKVKKNNIEVHFFELNEHNERIWTAKGNFMQSDVHHQYAIDCRTPPYKDKEITSNVKVFIELVRPSDGRTSEPKDFMYKADPIALQTKKRKANSSYSSLNSDGSRNSLSGLPLTIEDINNDINMHMKNDAVEIMKAPFTITNDINMHNMKNDTDEIMKAPFTITIPHISQEPISTEALMGDAIMYDVGKHSPMPSPQPTFSPMLSQPNVPAPPVLSLNSSEMDRLVKPTGNNISDFENFLKTGDLTEYLSNYSCEFLNDPTAMTFIKCSLVSDSGRSKNMENVKEEIHYQSGSAEEVNKFKKENIDKKAINEYSAQYTAEDGAEVKQLVKEICEIIKNKSGFKKQVVRKKLERLFDIRLSNGDTFLHMTLCSNQPSLEYIVKLVHSMNMTRLLNIKNNLNQTLLHLAILNDSPRLVSFLIAKGCDPMVEDENGNTLVHYAVMCQSCLGPLLDAVKKNEVRCDLNAYNNDKHTALHVAVLYTSEESVEMLVRAGAALSARDAGGRTPLHLAVLDDCLPVARALVLATPQTEIDAIDGSGFTALQKACDGPVRQNTVEIVKLLLEKNADPMKHEDLNLPAWKMARHKPELKEAIYKFVDSNVYEEDVKSEPEDEYESADEGESESLEGLSGYVREVSQALDGGAWRALAARLRRAALAACYQAAPSPTTALLNHVKECGDECSSESLALLLEDMGETEAAMIIRRYLDQ